MWTQPTLSRRELLSKAGNGFGLLALADLLATEARDGEAREPDRASQPYAVRAPHHAGAPKESFFCTCPADLRMWICLILNRDSDKTTASRFPSRSRSSNARRPATCWLRRGSSPGTASAGIEVSELLPHLACHIDDICVIRSMVADNINHTGAALQMCTGEQAFSRPSMGSWLVYGLGTENQNLPGFVVVSPAAVFQGAQLWASSFLPSAYQGTLVRDLKNPIANLTDPSGDLERQRTKLDALAPAQRHPQTRPRDRQPARRADRLVRTGVPHATRSARGVRYHARERQTKKLYGIDNPTTELFGQQCLLARRLVERGVRFVQLFDAPANNAWDHHSGLRENLPKRCAAVDQPIAALLCDLKARGLLDDTLVLWGGEFGRTPTAEGTNGREHHPFGFTMWLAGGGVRGGMVHGATDEFGWHAVETRSMSTTCTPPSCT